MFPLRVRAFFVLIGLFLLCSAVDKWLEKYGYNRRQDIKKGIQVKMLPHVIVFQVCRAYYCLLICGDAHRNRS